MCDCVSQGSNMTGLTNTQVCECDTNPSRPDWRQLSLLGAMMAATTLMYLRPQIWSPCSFQPDLKVFFTVCLKVGGMRIVFAKFDSQFGKYKLSSRRFSTCISIYLSIYNNTIIFTYIYMSIQYTTGVSRILQTIPGELAFSGYFQKTTPYSRI